MNIFKITTAISRTLITAALLTAAITCAANDDDINVLETVTGADINKVINHLLGKSQLASSGQKLYDMDENGIIDGNDLNILINIALGKRLDIRNGIFKINGVEFKMIKVEGGVLDCGVFGKRQIKDFWIMETELTNEQVNAIRTKYGLTNMSHPSVQYYYEQYYNIVDQNGSSIGKMDYVNQSPCIFRTLDLLKQYVETMSKLGLRLPSADEWEYAARGGKHSNGYKYAGSDSIDDVAWYVGNYDTGQVEWLYYQYYAAYCGTFSQYCNMPHPVKSKQPNELGLYDMSGNAAEVTVVKNATYKIDNGRYMYQGGSTLSMPDECIPGMACDPIQNYANIYGMEYGSVKGDTSQPFKAVGMRLVMSANDSPAPQSLIENQTNNSRETPLSQAQTTYNLQP